MKSSLIHVQSNYNKQPVELCDKNDKLSISLIKTVDSFEPINKENVDVVDDVEQNIKYRHVFKHAKRLWGKPLGEIKPRPVPDWNTIRSEEEFLKAPTVEKFLELEKELKDCLISVGHQKFMWIDNLAIPPIPTILVPSDSPKTNKIREKHEHWMEKVNTNQRHGEIKAVKRTEKRHKKIAEKGLGYGGAMTNVIANSKETAFFMKNNYTIRGNVFKLGHRLIPKNIYEIMPRYGSRKGGHIAVRVTQFTLTSLLTAVGYALAPVTFGISKIVSDHARTVLTLTGESITHKIAGAGRKKITMHAGLRGMQLEMSNSIPIAGQIINAAENLAFGTAAFGIVSTMLADMIMAQFSTRYTSKINLDDLGDSRCLEELNVRIDYLCRFFLPYGQYLLLKELNMEKRKKLKKVLKKHFKTLRDLEKKKVQSLNFYRLGLISERIPDCRREIIRADCDKALPETRINTHRIVKRCLSGLIDKDNELKELLRIQESIECQNKQKPTQIRVQFRPNVVYI